MKGDSLVCFFITDYYLENLVKSLERKGRSNIDLLIRQNQTLTVWKVFTCN